MTISKILNATLRNLFALLLLFVVTPVSAHTLPESHGFISVLLHPLFSLDHVLARLLLGSVIVFLSYLITNSSQHKLEKLFGVGFAVSGIVMLFGL